jgi:hypothetical protein
MKWGATGFLILFAAFILLLIFNPNLSCFGKRVRSPFIPLLRRRQARKAKTEKKIETTDYGFHPVDEAPGPGASSAPPGAGAAKAPTRAEIEAKKKARDYGFKLD